MLFRPQVSGHVLNWLPPVLVAIDHALPLQSCLMQKAASRELCFGDGLRQRRHCQYVEMKGVGFEVMAVRACNAVKGVVEKGEVVVVVVVVEVEHEMWMCEVTLI